MILYYFKISHIKRIKIYLINVKQNYPNSASDVPFLYFSSIFALATRELQARTLTTHYHFAHNHHSFHDLSFGYDYLSLFILFRHYAEAGAPKNHGSFSVSSFAFEASLFSVLHHCGRLLPKINTSIDLNCR